MSAAPTPDLFARPAAEDWLVSRLRALGHPLEPDPTVPLKDRLRERITTAGIGSVIAGRRPDGNGAEDFAAAFERVYGEQLAPKAPRGTRSTQRKALTP